MASKAIRAKTYAFLAAVSINLLSHTPDTFAFNGPSESDMPLGHRSQWQKYIPPKLDISHHGIQSNIN